MTSGDCLLSIFEIAGSADLLDHRQIVAGYEDTARSARPAGLDRRAANRLILALSAARDRHSALPLVLAGIAREYDGVITRVDNEHETTRYVAGRHVTCDSGEHFVANIVADAGK